MISAYGINTVVYEKEYDQEEFDLIKGIFDFNDIKLIKISDEEDEPQCLSQGRKVVIPNDDSFRIG
jgi:deoxycytidylate deaminase